jgi:hypothetical protein
MGRAQRITHRAGLHPDQTTEVPMPKFLVERTITGFGSLSPEKINDVASRVRSSLKSLGGRVQWVETFVAQDKIFTILIAPDEGTIREYSKLVEMPIDAIHHIKSVIDPATGE